MAKHKRWSTAAKFEIALQAVKGETTMSEICNKYQVSPSQVHAWKKQLMEQGQDIFAKKADKAVAKKADTLEKKQVKLYETIGQLTVERDYLKKSWEKFQDSDDES